MMMMKNKKKNLKKKKKKKKEKKMNVIEQEMDHQHSPRSGGTADWRCA